MEHALDWDPMQVRGLRREEYAKLAELGFFENERVELLEGMVVRMSPHGPVHDSTIQRLNRMLMEAVGRRADIRIQSAFEASDGSQPEPDAHDHPGPRVRDVPRS